MTEDFKSNLRRLAELKKGVRTQPLPQPQPREVVDNTEEGSQMQIYFRDVVIPTLDAVKQIYLAGKESNLGANPEIVTINCHLRWIDNTTGGQEGHGIFCNCAFAPWVRVSGGYGDIGFSELGQVTRYDDPEKLEKIILSALKDPEKTKGHFSTPSSPRDDTSLS